MTIKFIYSGEYQDLVSPELEAKLNVILEEKLNFEPTPVLF